MPVDAATAETRSFIATPDRLPDLDAWIECVGSTSRLPAAVVFRARVCVAEIAANLLEHGRARHDGDEISVTLRPSDDVLDIELSDTGRAFDPTVPGPEAPDADAPGGRGLRLLHAYATDMSYRREAGRNILSLRVAQAPRRAA